MSKGRILLYNAVGGTFADSDRSPSLSLMALSAYLKEKGYECLLLGNRLSDEELRLLLADCLAVGFSVYTGNGIDYALRMAKRVRSLSPGMPIVWGGCHPTLEPEQALQSDCVDYVVRGEGEKTLVELLEYLAHTTEGDLSAIEGLSFRRGDEVLHNGGRTPSRISEFPRYDFELFDDVLKGSTSVPYVAGRGCPFDCRYCCAAAFHRVSGGKKYDRYNIERIFDDLEAITRLYPGKTIDFWDDTFFSSENSIARFIDTYESRGLSFKWTAYVRCDLFSTLDSEVLQGMKRIHLQTLFFGVESGSQRILDMVRKKMRIDQVTTAAQLAGEAGLPADYTFINGFPNETIGDVRDSLRLRNYIRRVNPKATVRFFSYTPLPRTELIEDCEKLGYKKPVTLDGWANYEFHSFRADWLSWHYNAMVNSIAWASFFDVMELPAGASWPMRFACLFLKWSGRLRLRLAWFRFAPEFWMVNYLYRRKSAHVV